MVGILVMGLMLFLHLRAILVGLIHIPQRMVLLLVMVVMLEVMLVMVAVVAGQVDMVVVLGILAVAMALLLLRLPQR